MKILPVSPESLEEGAKILKNGGLVAFPTETVYGLGADAFNAKALAKVFEVKKRPFFDPLIVHIASIETLEKVSDLSLLDEERRKKLFLLAENLWPGPLSIVLPKNKKIPDIATAGLQTTAIRFPDHDTALKLISLSTGAVAAPSANLFGSLSPTRAEHVKNGLEESIDMILDGGSSRIGLESTVLDITGDTIKILRPGGTPKEAIEKLIGPVGDNNEQETKCDKQDGLTSPGMLKSHYAPSTPLFVLSREEIINKSINNSEFQNSAFLFFDGTTRDLFLNTQKPPHHATKFPAQVVTIKVLSETGNMLEAGSRLFETLHELDNSNVKQIFAQPAPNEGLGEAINDRLKKGSVR